MVKKDDNLDIREVKIRLVGDTPLLMSPKYFHLGYKFEKPVVHYDYFHGRQGKEWTGKQR